MRFIFFLLLLIFAACSPNEEKAPETTCEANRALLLAPIESELRENLAIRLDSFCKIINESDNSDNNDVHSLKMNYLNAPILLSLFKPISCAAHRQFSITISSDNKLVIEMKNEQPYFDIDFSRLRSLFHRYYLKENPSSAVIRLAPRKGADPIFVHQTISALLDEYFLIVQAENKIDSAKFCSLDRLSILKIKEKYPFTITYKVIVPPPPITF